MLVSWYNWCASFLCGQKRYWFGDVEPCAGTDTDEPSCGIAIMDTDGEWIEMKKRHQASRRMQLQHNNTMRQRTR